MATPLSLEVDWTLLWSSVSDWLLVYPITSTSSDSEMDEGDPEEEEFVLETVEVLHSETERRFESALCAFNCSSRRLR